jgi:hypothetical protein
MLVLWLRSYASADAIGYAGRYRAGEVSFVNGRLHIWRWTTNDPSWAANAWWPGWRYEATGPMNSWAYRLPGGTVTSSFAFADTSYLRHSLPRATSAAAGTIWYFHMPAWAVALITAAPPAWWAYRRHRQRAARARQLGLCPTCGYDLRATPQTPQEGGGLLDRCPECGSVATPPSGRTLPTKAA